MKPSTIIPLTTACIAAITFTSCSLDPEYREWKKNQSASTSTPADATTNPYGVPQAAGEAGSYTQTPPAGAGGAAPYQPLPGVAQPGIPASPEIPGVPAAGGISHTVVSGDSLWGLARKYGTTIEAIQAANSLTTTNIRTGQTLTIPGR